MRDLLFAVRNGFGDNFDYLPTQHVRDLVCPLSSSLTVSLMSAQQTVRHLVNAPRDCFTDHFFWSYTHKAGSA